MPATEPACIVENRSAVHGFDALAARLSEYLSAEQIDKVARAYAIAAGAHSGQTRKSGEDYITHPVAVASILAELRLDDETLCAAILHDALEDTPLSRVEIADAFGESVAELVDGVTKLDQLRFSSRQEAAAESFRKMLLAMARDLRVILIKLADRLHNMRTLDAMSTEARWRIARETLGIYAPVAQRLGMNRIKSELQDLGFRSLYPRRHAVILKRIRSEPVVRREALALIEARLAQKLVSEGLEHRLVGRIKGPWSVYNKMRQEQKSFDQVMDVFGFRVVVQNVAQCYHALGAVHSVYKPVDGRFRDFIAIPKANGYESLHTVLFGPYGSPIEVQIRTEEMDMIAERGIAAHWSYKTGESAGNSAQSRAHDWVRNLLESQKYAGSSLEFLENVKVDLFPDEVYLFSPRGDILSLPRNATALDFAFTVHTDVGAHAVAARVDRKLKPLHTRLSSGQTVEIITAPSATPSPQWLEFVVSSKARTAIRHFLKRLEHEDAVELGHRMLDRALETFASSLERVGQVRLDQYLAEQRYRRLEELLADIALGNKMPAQVAQTLLRDKDDGALPASALSERYSDKILVSGNERGVITFAACCRPIPGDAIMGYLSSGKGVVVHREECRNVAEFRKTPDRLIAIDWDRQVAGDYHTALRCDVDNKPGVLARVAAAIAERNANIDSVEYRERDDNASVMDFVIEVRDRRHLADVIRRVRRLSVVNGVQRV
ncbi:MAG: bifunctional (p)ppGpp synthetase/guanosine-3',5'-bis(diphosphate) 3'-pyrophosphohydrolase [Xanthomonadaceae bacterium]|nr:bifunctional (p)ppGpp synthetase/guanosine-3',5'-bis(diphosphate) 3'-pyrophosphohydrolase [Xanthomonadaceae bacterium]MDP2184449.1 bifunctional (p)ppGpp synthetase/guanosine-3',5'-bis(diphosphate) 3'-pyrophosphohydrolase [Xanthomonadales bacterium]MDZ4114578.1 bifunctional (p)ppGpp synthetase/guanosine-3',5'-bis(diphosphate) 3'-pyrophosphohydrolase [Xanthomonadaceae bacterium]MDZ4379669.1 bifunctional (p)ppGpp synthetase/guanosine-3',5'-bis(diphosphate) 3'-pyrophosphohydrolase [Xanthomonadace